MSTLSLTRQVTFWLVENGFRVLIAACDTFRAGAVEQLRTHTRKLNALHPPERHEGLQMVQLYEKGYGKDAAGIAMEAINFGVFNFSGFFLFLLILYLSHSLVICFSTSFTFCPNSTIQTITDENRSYISLNFIF